MLFSSVAFIFLYLPVVLATLLFLQSRGLVDLAKMWLIVTSIVFYGNFIPIHLALLVVSTLVNFTLGRALLERRSGRILFVGVVLNLAVLIAFKYSDFLITNANAALNLNIPTIGLVIPLALSFFTFQKLAYLIDVYRGGAPRYSLRDFVLFVVFFPQLIAGPIVHHRTIMPQIAKLGARRDFALDLAVGATAFLLGLFKKVCLADSLSIYSDVTFGAVEQGEHIDLISAWAGAIAFALQIYFDFSGYSDMALGLGRMLGIRLPVNFLSPYKSTSIIEFWRRWHITLSDFLKNYLYIPLGGNRHGAVRRYANLWIVMLLGGLWHGANWTFFVWGGLHGLFLSVNHAYRNWPRRARRSGFGATYLSWAITMTAVLVAWVFFRAPNFTTAFAMLSAMSGHNGITLPSAALPLATIAPALVAGFGISFGGLGYLAAAGPLYLLWFPIGIIVCLAVPNTAEWLARWELAINYTVQNKRGIFPLYWAANLPWGLTFGALLAFCMLYQRTAAQFLYFQF